MYGSLWNIYGSLWIMHGSVGNMYGSVGAFEKVQGLFEENMSTCMKICRRVSPKETIFCKRDL